MLSLRNRFGIPGIISVIALVFAMLGGAYAASNSSGGGKATASAKAKKGPRGPKGATGPAGPAGAQGPAGANGKDGSNGTNGSNGATGAAGAPGKSVKVTQTASNCIEGGVTVEVEGSGTPGEVCNGEEGPQGPQGPAGSAGGNLEPGVTETGAWTMIVPQVATYGGSETSRATTSLSFPTPLSAPLDSSHVHFVTGPGGGSCTGNIEHPTAASGHLCVYAFLLHGEFPHIENFEEAGAEKFGALISIQAAEGGSGIYAVGSWAVTG